MAIGSSREHRPILEQRSPVIAALLRLAWSSRASVILVALMLVFPLARAGDWNGDSVDSAGLYDPSGGRFFLRNAHGGGYADHRFRYGAAGAGLQALAGDWNGDGVDTVGLYDPSSGIFHLKNNNTVGVSDIAYRYGPVGLGWVPLVGDWNGDGRVTVGLYDPAAGRFHLRDLHSPGVAYHSFRYGPIASAMLPLSGDWDGDGVDSVGLYNPATGVFFLKNSHGGGGADLSYRYGPTNAGWAPIAGDWNGDRQDTPGLYDPATGVFHLKTSHTDPTATLAYRFGLAGVGWMPLGTPRLPPGEALDPEQRTMLQLVNDARTRGQDCGSRGVFGPASALVWNDRLAAAAQRHSDDMASANLFSHTGSDGSNVAGRTTDAGYLWQAVGENIAAGYTTVQAVVNAWLNSDGHCANIMRSSFEEFGSARADELNSTYRIYWTQVFATPP